MPYSSLEKTREHIRTKKMKDPEWRQSQLNYAKQYYQDNKEKWVKNHKETGENDTGRKYRDMVNNLLIARDGNLCSICNEILDPTVEVLHIDHILPRCMGGTHEATNIRLVHATCNLTRGKRITTEDLEKLYAK